LPVVNYRVAAGIDPLAFFRRERRGNRVGGG